jgi:hypothetical protein
LGPCEHDELAAAHGGRCGSAHQNAVAFEQGGLHADAHDPDGDQGAPQPSGRDHGGNRGRGGGEREESHPTRPISSIGASGFGPVWYPSARAAGRRAFAVLPRHMVDFVFGFRVQARARLIEDQQIPSVPLRRGEHDVRRYRSHLLSSAAGRPRSWHATLVVPQDWSADHAHRKVAFLTKNASILPYV